MRQETLYFCYITKYRYTWQEAITLSCGSNIFPVFTKALCSRRGLVGLPIRQSLQSPACRSWQCIPCWLPSMRKFDLQAREFDQHGQTNHRMLRETGDFLSGFAFISCDLVLVYAIHNWKTLPMCSLSSGVPTIPRRQNHHSPTSQRVWVRFSWSWFDPRLNLDWTWGSECLSWTHGVPATHQPLSTVAQKQDIEQKNDKKDSTIYYSHVSSGASKTPSQTYTKREPYPNILVNQLNIIQATSLCFWSCTFRPLSTFPSGLDDIFQRAQQQVEGFTIQDQTLGLGKNRLAEDWGMIYDVGAS